MALTEAEELELLSLERERSLSNKQTQTPDHNDNGFLDQWKSNAAQDINDFGSRWDERLADVNKPTIGQGVASIPEKALRYAGGAIGNIGDAVFTAGNVATGGGLKTASATVMNLLNKIPQIKGTDKVAQALDELKADNPAAYTDLKQIPNLLGVIPGAKVAEEVPGMAKVATQGALNTAKDAKTAIGQGIENTGKSALQKEMKIKDVTAKLAGPNVDAGVQKIVDDISKYNVQSTKGGVKGIAENAQKAIDGKMSLTDKAIKDFAAKNPTASVNVDDTFLKLMDDLQKGNEPTIFTTEEQASEFAGKIHDALGKRNLTGTQPISKLPEIKRTIDEGLDLFKKGKYGVETDPLPKKVGEISYLRLKKELESYVPEVKESNQAVHDLINVKTAALEASKRIGNKNNIGLADLATLLGGGPALHSMGVPASVSSVAPIIAATIMAKKMASGGRLPSALISIGKGIK